MSDNKNRSVSLDLLRGLSILYIVGFWHMFNYTSAFPQYSNIITLRFTWIILATFTFLSGYFIGQKEIDLKKTTIIRFYKNRILRIYPLYLLSLVLFYILGLSDTVTTIKAAFAISMFLKPAPPTLWFITMLLFFYVLSPLLIFNTKKGYVVRIWAIYIFLSTILLIVNYSVENLDVRVVIYFPAFFLGIITAMNGGEIIGKKLGLSLFFAGAVLSFGMNQNYLEYDRLLSILMISMASYFIFIFFKNNVNPSPKTHLTITVIAYSSYCMYLFHRPIYMSLTHVYFPNDGVLQILYLVLFCVPSILMISYYSQKYQDITIKSLTNRFTR